MTVSSLWRKRAALGGLVAALAASGVFFWLGSRHHEVSRVEVTQSVSQEWNRILQAGLEEALRGHDEVEVSVRFAASAAPSVGAAALGADVWVGPGTAAGIAMLDFPVLAFRRDLVTDAPETWAQLADTALALKAEKNLAYGVALPDSEQLLGAVVGVRGAGDELEPASIGLELLAQLRGQYRLATVGCSEECAVSVLVAGQAPFAVVSSRSLAELETRLGDRLGVAALPALPGEPGRHRVQATALVVERGSSGTPAHAAALELVATSLEAVMAHNASALRIVPTRTDAGGSVRPGALGDNDRTLQRIGREHAQVGSSGARVALAAAVRPVFRD